MRKDKLINLLNKMGCDIEYRIKERLSGSPVCYITRIGDKKYTTDQQTYANRDLKKLYNKVMEDSDD